MSEHTFCRLCEASCGLRAELAGGQLVALSGDPDDPVSRGFCCDVARASPKALRHPGRITRPMRRVDGHLQPVGWDEAIREIGAAVRAIRARSGPRALSLYLGPAIQRRSRSLIRALAFGVGLGTPNLFSAIFQAGGPRLRMAELMLGHPVALQPDLGRAHHVLLLGGDQRRTHWGPLHAGMAHEAEIRHSRKTKGTRVVVADPRRTDLAAEMDQHLPVLPGREPFLLLGMVSAIVRGKWADKQYLADYCSHGERVADVVGEWPVQRCAAAAGLDPAQLSGSTLKFSRAAMAVAHAGPSTFMNPWSAVGAWSWLALHTLTANMLRPGGLYDHCPFFDLHALMGAVPTAQAPRTRLTDHPLLLLQAPASLLADEVLTPGEGQVRVLFCLGGDPLADLPGSPRVSEALDRLDLLVCLATHENASTARAHWVLPVAHPWERQDLHVHDTATLPVRMTAWTPALTPPAGEARPDEDVLRDLFAAIKPGLRCSSWGRHLTVLARLVARADFNTWQERLVEWATDGSWSDLEAPPHRLFRGEIDRAVWRVTTEDGRIDLVPDELVDALARLAEPRPDPELPLVLRTSARVDQAPDAAHRVADVGTGVRVHPDSGVPDGASVQVVTRHGRIRTVALHDPDLRPGVADLPWGPGGEAMALLDARTVDPITGAPALDGLACAVVRD